MAGRRRDGRPPRDRTISPEAVASSSPVPVLRTAAAYAAGRSTASCGLAVRDRPWPSPSVPAPPGIPQATSGAIPTGSARGSARCNGSAPRAGARSVTVLRERTDAPRVRGAVTLPWVPGWSPGDRVELSGRIRPRRTITASTSPSSCNRDAPSRLAGSPSSKGTIERRLRGVPARSGRHPTVDGRTGGRAGCGVLIGLRDRVDRVGQRGHDRRPDPAARSAAGASDRGLDVGAVAERPQPRRRAMITAIAIAQFYEAFVGPCPRPWFASRDMVRG